MGFGAAEPLPSAATMPAKAAAFAVEGSQPARWLGNRETVDDLLFVMAKVGLALAGFASIATALAHRQEGM